MSSFEIGISIFFISWTFGAALLGYKYGYSDGCECCNKEWRKKVEGLKDKIKERKNKCYVK